MAAVTLLGTPTFTTTAGNKTITATPTAGRLVVIMCANSGRTTAQFPTITDNNSDGRGTYTRVSSADATKNTSADSMWLFIRNALIGSATSTVFTMTQASDSGGGFVIYEVSAMSIVGLSAVRRTGVSSYNVGVQNNQAAATPAPALPTAALTGNPVIGMIFNGTSPAGLTPPASWTESPTPDLGYTVPAAGLENVRRDSGFTGTTVTWGGASASAFCSMVAELDTSVPQYDWVSPGRADKDANRFIQGAVGRASVW